MDDLGINAAIKGLVKDTSIRTGTDVCFVCEGELDDLDDPTKTALYRMLQECLTNIARHAQATKVHVLLGAGDGEIQMIVVDNGRGFSPQGQFTPGASGLFGLGERASQLGGTVAVESAPGQGTRVVVQLPLARNAGSVRDQRQVGLEAVD